MKKLKEIFDRQKKFTEKVLQKKLTDLSNIEKQNLTKDYILFATDELFEVLGCINYKSHVDKNKKVNIKDIQVELIDVQKYLINLMLVWNLDAEKFIETFHEKSNLVEYKYENRNLLK